MRKSRHQYFHLNRRHFIKCAAAGSVIVGAPAVLKGLTRRAKAADKGTIRFLTTAPTLVPGDWETFERETGFKMENTIIKDDPGIFLTEMEVNDGGERFDVIAALSGVEQSLIDSGLIMQIDTNQIPNWAGMTGSVKQVPYLVRDLKPESERVWGIPFVMNADSFGYFPEKLGEPRPPEEVSWSLVFDSEKTLGRTSTGDNYIYLWEVIAYLKHTGDLQVADITNPTPKEAEAAADFLIERKKAGQFRNFWKTFDDQVSDVKNGEVDALVCWEPVVREAQKSGLDFAYANGKEFLLKWMHACYIPAQAADSDRLEDVYAVLDWILSGSYAAAITPLRGYVTGRPDLGKQYAEEHELGPSTAKAIDEALNKLDVKFAKEDFWFNAVPEHLLDIQAQMDRVLNA